PPRRWPGARRGRSRGQPPLGSVTRRVGRQFPQWRGGQHGSSPHRVRLGRLPGRLGPERSFRTGPGTVL
ncbi:uncharacterized protein METZ01_LOCUS271576, partial [marine metagenome]